MYTSSLKECIKEWIFNLYELKYASGEQSYARIHACLSCKDAWNVDRMLTALTDQAFQLGGHRWQVATMHHVSLHACLLLTSDDSTTQGCWRRWDSKKKNSRVQTSNPPARCFFYYFFIISIIRVRPECVSRPRGQVLHGAVLSEAATAHSSLVGSHSMHHEARRQAGGGRRPGQSR